MGVMQCNREGCEKILCDRYNPDFGYICFECFEELTHFLKCREEISTDAVSQFFKTPKNSPLDKKRKERLHELITETINEWFPTKEKRNL